MASAEEQDAQFTAGDVERRVAELERKLSLLNESGLDRLSQSGYLQFDGVPVRIDSNGIQIESPGSGDRGAVTFVPVFRSGNPATYPYGQLAGYSTDNPSSADEANVTLGAAASSTVNANLFLLGSAFAVGQARFSVNGGGVNAQLKLEVSSSGGYLEVINATLRLDDTTSDPGTLADADMWYRSDTDKFRGRANSATDNFAMEGWVSAEILAAGGSSMPMPPIVGTQSWNCLGVEMAAQTVAAPASATWPTNNRVLGIPVKVTEDCTVTKLWVMNGATANANINMCLYDSSFAQIANSEMGSTAQAGTDVIQEFDITNVAITAGLYYIACVFSATTGTAYRVVAGGVAPIEVGQSWGIWQQDLANVDLPSTATPAVAAASFTPIMGMSVSPRTLVT